MKTETYWQNWVYADILGVDWDEICRLKWWMAVMAVTTNQPFVFLWSEI